MRSSLLSIPNFHLIVPSLIWCEVLAGANLPLVQLRMKSSSTETIRVTAMRAKALLPQSLIIINDDVQAAKDSGAHGVHLGQGDSPIAETRQYLGEKAIIGATANTLAQALQAYTDGANYIGLGPLRLSQTKADTVPALGFEGVSACLEGLRKEGVDLPVIVIGGIQQADIIALKRLGAAGIALSHAILSHPSPIQAIQDYRSCLSLDQSSEEKS